MLMYSVKESHDSLKPKYFFIHFPFGSHGAGEKQILDAAILPLIGSAIYNYCL